MKHTWHNTNYKVLGNIVCIVQRKCKKETLLTDDGPQNSFRVLDRHRVVFLVTLEDGAYKISKEYGGAVVREETYFWGNVRNIARQYGKLMSRVLTFDDFKWISTNNNKKESGYFSLFLRGYELCLEEYKNEWTTYLCTKSGEVIQEKTVGTEELALIEINELYRGITVSLIK